jgi:outer membrane protein assembly factor BamB
LEHGNCFVLKNAFVIWIFSFFLLAFSGASQDWLGFRGLDQQGVGSEPSTPIDWSGQIDTTWKAPVRGFGYSSPVVMQDGIYLTTAYEMQKGKDLRNGLAYLNQALSWVLAVIAAVFAIGATTANGYGRWVSLLNGCRSFFIMSAALLILGICAFGESFFHLESSTVRSWKIGTAAALISLSLILLLMPRSKIASVMFAVLATSLSAFAYTFFPLQDIFLDSRISGAVICTSVILLPAVMGWAAFVGLRMAKAPTSVALPRARIRFARIALCCGLAPLFAIAAFWALRLRMERTIQPTPWNGRAPDEVPISVQVEPSLGWPLMALMAILAVLAIVIGSIWVLKKQESLRWLPRCGAAASVLLAFSCFVSFSVFPLKREMAHAVVCIDKNAGTVRWLRQIGYNSTIRDFKGANSHATPTIAAGPGRLCAYFGLPGLFGMDPAGKVSWKVTDAEFDSPYGIGHSPVVADDIVILVNDHERYPQDKGSKSYIIAYSLKEGRVLWRQPRDRSQPRSAGFSTPIVRTVKGKKTILMRGWDDLSAYDLQTGQLQWNCHLKHRSSVLVASLVADEKYVYVLDGAGVRALDLEALAERRDAVAWLVPAPGEKVASPVLVDGLLFFATDTGMAFCVDVDKRRVVWREKLGGRFFSSAVAQGDCVIFADESGKVSVVARDRTFKLIAQVEIGEKVYASPAPQADGLLIRGATNLFYLKAAQPGISGTTQNWE